ncbi:lytic transglycosylase domain-containing protein [Neobacillus novalis]|uniref:Lytic transglycosylase domain-containing protein n=1 Tax=Neobacillus novalis TaxID=220687 RepID=A0AA95S8N3_9BACI|nr:lytic transglycosylase domain-containing protein [Neobacillus novalis]WHY86055.1 lytic transglycosylase domain-containing protein [Neobacillus novalis]
MKMNNPYLETIINYKHKLTYLANRTKEDTILTINKYSSVYQVDPEIIYSFILIESMNRGGIFTRKLEKFCSFFPYLLVKLDPSLGLGQVKISTAKMVWNSSCDTEIIKKLLNPQNNIELVSNLLSIYLKDCKGENNKFMSLVKLYTTGNKFTPINRELIIYYNLLCWSISNHTYKKTTIKYSKINNLGTLRPVPRCVKSPAD